jgi:multisubunit Na+/H+ antiporter MnhB subunit
VTERIFQIAAVVLAGTAAYFLWRGNADGAFISGVAGAVSFFLSVRFQVRERNRQREAEENLETPELEEKIRLEEETEELQKNKIEG